MPITQRFVRAISATSSYTYSTATIIGRKNLFILKYTTLK